MFDPLHDEVSHEPEDSLYTMRKSKKSIDAVYPASHTHSPRSVLHVPCPSQASGDHVSPETHGTAMAARALVRRAGRGKGPGARRRQRGKEEK